MEDNKNEIEKISSEIDSNENAISENEVTNLEENKNENEDDYAKQELQAQNAETFKQVGPMRMILRRFFRSKLSIVGLCMLIFLFLFSFLGPVFYPIWGETGYDNTPNSEFVVEEKTNEDGVVVKEVIEMVYTMNKYANPSINHLLGTDDQAYDVFTRLMYGGRISLTIGFIVVILETLIGILLGGLAGYFGGWVDNVIMRIVDIFTCIPTLPILLICSAVIDSWGLTADQRIYVLMVVITLFSWSGTARVVRGQILFLREQEYITATEVMGLPTWRRIFKHLIPNVMPQLIVSMTLGLGSVILYESTLSYLGLGVQVPKAAWGTMIALANDPVVLNYHVNVWLPAGIMIVIAVLGFNFVGDGLRDAMDPKAKK